MHRDLINLCQSNRSERVGISNSQKTLASLHRQSNTPRNQHNSCQLAPQIGSEASVRDLTGSLPTLYSLPFREFCTHLDADPRYAGSS
jgi:hypothetical protein